jgi:hypothetical protein
MRRTLVGLEVQKLMAGTESIKDLIGWISLVLMAEEF